MVQRSAIAIFGNMLGLLHRASSMKHPTMMIVKQIMELQNDILLFYFMLCSVINYYDNFGWISQVLLYRFPKVMQTTKAHLIDNFFLFF